jgi:hypothetical protein
VTVELPDELAARVAAVAAARGMTLEQLAVEELASRYAGPGMSTLSFIGVGASGGQQPSAREHREIIRDVYRGRPAREV